MGELVQYMNLKSLGPSECDLTPNRELDSDLEQSLKDWTDISHEYAVSKILKKTLWKFLVIFFCQNQIFKVFLTCIASRNSLLFINLLKDSDRFSS